MAENTYEKLFTEFPPVTVQEWEAKISEDLKGADRDKKLVWRSPEGIDLQPYYRKEDVEGIPAVRSLPGMFPFVRGNRKTDNTWYIRQDIKVSNASEANREALSILNKGVNSLGFDLPCTDTGVIDIQELLADVCLDAIELNLGRGNKMLHYAEPLLQYIDAKGFDKNNLHISLDFEPLSHLVRKGCYYANDARTSMANCASLISKCDGIPGLRVIGIHGEDFHNAGATLVQELALSLAMASEYLLHTVAQGLSADQVVPRLKFCFAAGANYFMEIAKIRAARQLWAQITEAWQPGAKATGDMNIHCVTSMWNMTVYDPYVNMLRTTTEGMSAVLGGADSLTVLPFDAPFSQGSEFSKRIARNQQIIFKEEAYLDKVVDPAAGSYYIEKLTASMAEAAWKLFLTIEEKGGFSKAFEAGYVHEIVEEAARKRDMNLATRRENLLGTNQFPNFNETIADVALHLADSAPDCSCKGGDCPAKPLKQYRGAQAFEALRIKADRREKRPVAFMLTIGNLAMRLARSQFSCNFFACGGFQTIDNNGFATPQAGVDAALAAGADLIVVCSSDEEYATLAPEVLRLAAGKAQVVVAGAPACMDELKAAGVEHFIHVRSNLLESLRQFHSLLGI